MESSLSKDPVDSITANGETLQANAYSTSAIIVSSRQRGNPVLRSIRSVPWEYGEIVPDYLLGRTTCCLYLSLRYHQLKPTYIQERLKQLGKQFDLRILLVQVDVTDPYPSLKELTKMCLLTDMTLMLAWSFEDAGQILETYKSFEFKPAEVIMEKHDSDPHSKMIDALTTIKSVNRTDASNLLSNFGSFDKIVAASEEDLSLCPGVGPLKASRIYKFLHEDFKKFGSPIKKQ